MKLNTQNFKTTTDLGNDAKPVLADSKIFSTTDVEKILDAYQIECQMKYDTRTVPDAREWFAKKFYFR